MLVDINENYKKVMGVEMERKIDRQAYLIIAFNNFKQLGMLISLLDHPYTDIFVFIDKKSRFSDSDRKYLVNGVNKSNVYFVPRINNYIRRSV